MNIIVEGEITECDREYCTFKLTPETKTEDARFDFKYSLDFEKSVVDAFIHKMKVRVSGIKEDEYIEMTDIKFI